MASAGVMQLVSRKTMHFSGESIQAMSWWLEEMMWSRPCGGAARRVSAKRVTAERAASAGASLIIMFSLSTGPEDGQVGPKEPRDGGLVHVIAGGQDDGRGDVLFIRLAAHDGHGG